MSYSQEERETILQFDEVDKEWNYYSRVRKHNTKVLRINGFKEKDRELSETGALIALSGTLPPSCVSFRNLKEKVELTDEQREERAERARMNFGIKK